MAVNNIFTGVCLVLFSITSVFCGGGDKILLSDAKVITLQQGKLTSARRSSPIPQIKCVGGSANGKFNPQTVQCYNRGSDGLDIQWECKADMDNEYRFGHVQVSCEGYSYADDPYILKGSCGLEYTLEYTKEGHEKQQGHYNQYHQQHHDSYNSHGDSYNSYGSKKVRRHSSWFGDIVMLAIIVVIIYVIYKTCLSSNHGDGTYNNDNQGHTYPGSPQGMGPPPPYPGTQQGTQAPPSAGFRQDFMPGSRSDGCSSTYANTHQSNQQQTGGGFWSGAATGGILGYLFGQNNSYSGNRGYNHRRPWNGWGWGSGSGSSWFGGNPGYTSSGWSSGGSSGHHSSSRGSSGTRTASGFGGTSRR